jgi:hypothetical protein
MAIEITFSEPVLGLALGDLRLSRNGQTLAFSGTTTLSTVDQVTWTLDHLSPLTTPLGDYRLELDSASSDIRGLLGNLLISGGVIEWRMSSPWHNPVNPYDVDGQNGVTALDVLLLINYLNANPGNTSLPSTSITPPPYYDVNNDGLITPLDVLMVINFINSQSAAEPEGESAAYAPPLVGLRQAAAFQALENADWLDGDDDGGLLPPDMLATINRGNHLQPDEARSEFFLPSLFDEKRSLDPVLHRSQDLEDILDDLAQALLQQ